ncbi:MAG: outer spore coat protein CotE [Firmicutes bacterium]|jgi:hypothetical protein|nr:outer spore coat protein CotE [Bacillota bacterium]
MSVIGARGATGEDYKEIITRAVYGRGEGEARGVVSFSGLGEVKKVLGTVATDFRVGEINIAPSQNGVTVLATGQFDVHVWYVRGDDTAIAKQPVVATVEIPVNPVGPEKFADMGVAVSVVKGPECRGAAITGAGDGVEVEVGATLAAEITGETSLRVVVPLFRPETPAQADPGSPGHESGPRPEGDDRASARYNG